MFVNSRRIYSGICGQIRVVPDLPPRPAEPGQDSKSGHLSHGKKGHCEHTPRRVSFLDCLLQDPSG